MLGDYQQREDRVNDSELDNNFFRRVSKFDIDSRQVDWRRLSRDKKK